MKFRPAVAVFLLCVQFGCHRPSLSKAPAVEKVIAENGAGAFSYQTGDLLFQDLDCGDLCDAIEKVTHGVNGKSFSHIGLVYVDGHSRFVIEAIGKDVHLTDVNEFVARSKDENGNPKILVGRLKNEFRKLNEDAIKFALGQLGTPYDDEFIYKNNKYYCSELIYDAYKKANHDKPFFELRPMTFKDPSTGHTFPAWIKYYKDLKAKIPQGQPGCNPAGISTSSKIEIVKSFF
jgi:hypothetical protein